MNIWIYIQYVVSWGLCECWSGVTCMASGKCESVGCSLLVPVWLLTTTERWWRLKFLHNHSLTLRLLTDIYGMRLEMSRWSVQRDRMVSLSDPGRVSVHCLSPWRGFCLCARQERQRAQRPHLCQEWQNILTQFLSPWAELVWNDTK